MNNSLQIGILGGFGPLPTAALYLRICSALNPRPEVIVLSPGISKETENMLLRHNINPELIEIISEAFQRLHSMQLDMLVLPSLTVISLLKEYGLAIDSLTEWFEAIHAEIEKFSPKRVGVIATDAVINHSDLIKNLRTKGMEPVFAQHLQDSFHEWILSCDGLRGTNAPSNRLLEGYKQFFQGESVNLCLLACTEACLFETSFLSLCQPIVNTYKILEQMTIFRLQKEANKGLQKDRFTICAPSATS